jgi:hypothetical protein
MSSSESHILLTWSTKAEGHTFLQESQACGPIAVGTSPNLISGFRTNQACSITSEEWPVTRRVVNLRTNKMKLRLWVVVP